MACCLALTCCKYKRLETQYEIVKRSSPDSEIIKKGQVEEEEESKPIRRNKPDKDTFGKVNKEDQEK